MDRKRIREAYERSEKLILSGEMRSPYSMDIDWKFTPIELNVWDEIRYLGLPLFPQYPVGPFFVDFGDPKRKIAIEVDGRQFHLNKEKDESREKKIRSLGWRVYRVPGYATFARSCDWDESMGISFEDYFEETVEGWLSFIYREFIEERNQR